MSDDDEGRNTKRHFLTVEEAARMLKTSRLRIREAVAMGDLSGRTDNEGRLRIDLPEAPVELGSGTPPADAVVDYLFDELDELYDALAMRDETIDRMTDLVARQDETLSRALSVLERRDAEVAGLADLVERALASAERMAAQKSGAEVEPLLARAMEAAERMEAQLVARDQQLTDREATLEHVLSLAERGLTAMKNSTKAGLWQRVIGTRRGPKP